MIEQTLVLVKPDGVARGLVGEIIKRFEQRGLKIVALKMVKVNPDFSKKHYSEHIDKSFYKDLEKYITQGPVTAMIIEGAEAINIVRKIVGSTFPGDANLGTIRGDFCHMSKDHAKTENKGYNLIHASANKTDAEKEISLWFSVNEIHNYKINSEEHVV